MCGKWRPARTHEFTGELGIVAGFMINAEELHDVLGWGVTPPLLYAVTWAAGGREVPEASMIVAPTAKDVGMYAQVLESGTEEDRALLDPGEPLGHFYVAEGYRPGRGVTILPGQDPADMVGSIETRFAVAMAGPSDVLYLRRDRGCIPEILQLCPEAGPIDFLGGEGIYPALRRLHDAARRLHG